jgi:beta-phosphoglucomutase-like phosphatase (HAD superfamily)
VIDAIVTTQGWDKYFTTHVSGDHVARGKPEPDIYLETARQMGVHPSECLALEDSPTGARAAVAAGMILYAVPDPSHSTHEAFESITPHVYSSLHEVRESLESCVFG